MPKIKTGNAWNNQQLFSNRGEWKNRANVSNLIHFFNLDILMLYVETVLVKYHSSEKLPLFHSQQMLTDLWSVSTLFYFISGFQHLLYLNFVSVCSADPRKYNCRRVSDLILNIRCTFGLKMPFCDLFCRPLFFAWFLFARPIFFVTPLFIFYYSSYCFLLI